MYKVKELLNVCDNSANLFRSLTAFCLIMPLEHLESYRIEFMPVILFGYFN